MSENWNVVNLQDAMHTSFIDKNYNSNLAYRSEFISNDYKQGKKVLSSIEHELANCDEFCISVAFITLSGITPLLQTLKELENKNIQGKILTTDYLMFSDPVALDKLSSLKNIELKMFCSDAETGGFHTKGYIFKKEELYHIIIGSSNMTLNAMTKNREWNTKIVASKNGAMVEDVLSEFSMFWQDEHSVSYDEIKERYKTQYDIIKKQQKIAKEQSVIALEQYTLKPNKMQVSFIQNLQNLQMHGEKKALLISATGERVIIVTGRRNAVNKRVSVA